jgi:hypothetical protein
MYLSLEAPDERRNTLPSLRDRETSISRSVERSGSEGISASATIFPLFWVNGVDGSDEDVPYVVRGKFLLGIGERPSLTDATVAAFLGRIGGDFTISAGNKRTAAKSKIAKT